jgi:hypothetical protein
MTDDKLEAIKARDASLGPYALTSTYCNADRRALLGYVRALRAELASVTTTMLAIREQRDGYSTELAALKEAAGKVKCWTCHGSGEIKWTSGSIMPRGAAPIPCPDCADLRKILGEKHE